MPNPPDQSLTILRPLAERFPNIDSAMAEIARLSAIRTLPKCALWWRRCSGTGWSPGNFATFLR